MERLSFLRTTPTENSRILMNPNTLYLKSNKSGLLHSKHPWVFDGAVDKGRGDPGAGIAHLFTADGRFAAVGSYNPKSAIAFRVFETFPCDIDLNFFIRRFSSARELREAVIGSETDGFRLVNSEGDGLAGLTVDSFAGHLVVQVGTPAMDALTPLWMDALTQALSPKSITRKDSQSTANREHMTSVSAVLYGEPPDTIAIRESGVSFHTAVLPGQKTGFYFDQRDNRVMVAALSKDKRVLDAYAYTGGFGAHALFAGAAFVTGVESSKPACDMAKINYRLSAETESRYEITEEDCVRYLKATDRVFDIAVLDPPALAKRRQHLPQAGRLYREIFESGIRKIVRKGGYLLACSCSAAVDTEAMLDILREAARAANRFMQIIRISGAGPDHPVSVHHPEGEYLKAVLLRVV
jgi:23S rRNA (cytosine1962-C5)-methyltransferase